MSGYRTASRAKARIPALTGRVTKMSRLPSDICIDCRSAFSSMGPSTSASTSGAGGQPYMRMTKPMPPNRIATPTVNMLFSTL